MMNYKFYYVTVLLFVGNFIISNYAISQVPNADSTVFTGANVYSVDKDEKQWFTTMAVFFTNQESYLEQGSTYYEVVTRDAEGLPNKVLIKYRAGAFAGPVKDREIMLLLYRGLPFRFGYPQWTDVNFMPVTNTTKDHLTFSAPQIAMIENLNRPYVLAEDAEFARLTKLNYDKLVKIQMSYGKVDRSNCLKKNFGYESDVYEVTDFDERGRPFKKEKEIGSRTVNYHNICAVRITVIGVQKIKIDNKGYQFRDVSFSFAPNEKSSFSQNSIGAMLGLVRDVNNINSVYDFATAPEGTQYFRIVSVK